MLSIFGIVGVGLVAVWKMIGYESSAPLTETEVDSRLKEILSRLVNEISINNFAFGGYAPDYKHIVDEYHKYEKSCEFIRRRDLKFYGLAEAINNIAAAVRTYKIEVLKLDADRQFYVELNNIQKELNLLSKQARIVRF